MALALGYLPIAAAISDPAVASTHEATLVSSTLQSTSFTDVDASNQF
ncbi:hypothetical protein [Arthrobacter humicola]